MSINTTSLIFVVDDNKVYNQLVSDYLKKKGYGNVMSFYSGEACLKELKNKNFPDIIVQDYNMDILNGIDVLKEVKKINPKTEFIFLSGNESTELIVNSIKYGAFDYVIKGRLALEKVIDKIQKIGNMIELKKKNKQIKQFMTITVVLLVGIVLASIFYFMFIKD